MEIYAPPIYEYGTWVPDLQFGGLKVGITYVVQLGFYTKIGSMVQIQGQLNLSSKGTSNGTIKITGVPYPLLGSSGQPPVSIFPNRLAYSGTPVAYISSNYFTIWQITEAGALTALTDAEMLDNSTLGFSGIYRTA